MNSIFDLLGLLAPVTIQGRLILRELTSEATDWDMHLPEDKQEDWARWQASLQELKELHVPHAYSSFSSAKAQNKVLHVFSDASVKAIVAVAYLKLPAQDGHSEVGFVFGKAKLAPQPDLTIPRLEPCAAVLAVEVVEIIIKELDLKLDTITFYTDSKVVLGYIHNQTRRFYVYVNNRV